MTHPEYCKHLLEVLKEQGYSHTRIDTEYYQHYRNLVTIVNAGKSRLSDTGLKKLSKLAGFEIEIESYKLVTILNQ